MIHPLVSIIIPCYNAAPFLAEAVNSALDQTWPEIEVIVINDGSVDDSSAIARSFKDNRVMVIDQTNRGASAARNAGLRASRGEFIQYLDADDLLASDKIALQLEGLAGGLKRTVASGAWGIFQGSVGDARFQPEAVWSDFKPIDWLICSWSGGGMMHPAAWLAPRAVLEAAGPWDESLSLDDDGEYFCRVLLHSEGVHFVETARSFYRSHAGPRLSASAGEKAARSSFAACVSKEKQLLAKEDTPRTRSACAQNYMRFSWEQLVAAPSLAAAAETRWHALDSSIRPPRTGRLHLFAARLFGWKIARRLQLKRRSLP